MVQPLLKTSEASLNARTGGTVPMVAGDRHLRVLPQLLEQLSKQVDVPVSRLPQHTSAISQPFHHHIQAASAIACAIGPGLAPCLEAGMAVAGALAQKLDKPFVAVNHMEAHALTGILTEPVSCLQASCIIYDVLQKAEFPQLVLLASGGHCMLLLLISRTS